ncbi:hypothetical protein ACFE04_005814 [Oxalis oulophora]
MSFVFNQQHRSQGGTSHDHRLSSFNRNTFSHKYTNRNIPYSRTSDNSHDFNGNFRQQNNGSNYVQHNVSNNVHHNGSNYVHSNGSSYVHPNGASSFKRRKFSDSTWGDGNKPTYEIPPPPPARLTAKASTSTSCKRDRSQLEDDEVVFLSRDEIDRCSPSRKDGIDALRETFLRYSYCAFIQNVGSRLELPQTTIATAMVLCHRFFVRRSHACHDRFLIATAALFLTAKSEETPRPLNNVLRASSEIIYKQDFSVLSYMLPVEWFEQYRERMLEAEQLILTTLNFEINVQHPYGPLTTVLSKLGLSQTVLVNLALNLLPSPSANVMWDSSGAGSIM